MYRSATERQSASFRIAFEVATAAARDVVVRSARRAARRPDEEPLGLRPHGRGAVALHRQEQRSALVRLQRDLEYRLARLEQDRLRRELDDGVAEIAGQPVVGEDDRVLRVHRRRDAAARPPPVPAHLEQVDEVHLEQQGEADVMRARVEVAHREALVGATASR